MANILTPFGLTPEHFARIDQMKTDPSSFGFKNQFDYARASGKDLVDRSMPGFGISSMMGQVLATPFYDTYSGIQESKKPYKDDFTQYSGITDYGEIYIDVNFSGIWPDSGDVLMLLEIESIVLLTSNIASIPVLADGVLE